MVMSLGTDEAKKIFNDLVEYPANYLGCAIPKSTSQPIQFVLCELVTRGRLLHHGVGLTQRVPSPSCSKSKAEIYRSFSEVHPPLLTGGMS